MNRRDRRAAARARRGVDGGALIGNPTDLARLDLHCPDCDSDLEPWTDRDGIRHVTVLHDDTCPVWQKIRGNR